MKQIYFFNYKTLLPLIVLLTLLISSRSTAQCSFYQYYNGGASSVANMTATGWAHNLTLANLSNGTAAAYAGRYYFTMTGTAPTKYISTPAITTPGTFASPSLLTFYYKGTTTTWNFKVEYDTTTAFASPTQIGVNYGTGATTGWLPASVNLSGVPAGAYVRIVYIAGTFLLDNLAVASPAAADNLLIVPAKGVTCTATLVSGRIYNFYDDGGASDTFSPSLSNVITFAPATPGEQITLDFQTFDTSATSTGNMSVTNVNPTFTSNYTGTTIPGGPYLSNGSNPVVTFNGLTTTTPGTGFWIKVSANPAVGTCSDLTALTASNYSSSSVQLNWTVPATQPSTGYDYYVTTSSSPALPSGAVTNSNTATLQVGTVAGGATSSTTISGLNSYPATYYAWVRSNCGTIYGTWVPIAGNSFGTICSAYSIPYLENFNGLNGPLPTCTSANNAAWTTNITNGNLFTGGASSINSMFFTKPLNLAAGTYRLTYDYSITDGTPGGNADFSVYVGSTNNAPTAGNISTLVTSHAGISTIASNVRDIVVVTPGTYYIGFKLTALSHPSSTLFNLDNISLDVENCLPPTSLTNSAISTSSVDLGWTASTSGPTNYEYYVSTSSTDPAYSDPATGSITPLPNPRTISPLSPGTTYYIWMRSDCGGTFSVWNGPTTFTTTAMPAADIITMPHIGAASITTCNGVFYDEGGSGANYTNFADGKYVISPGTPGKKLKVVFTSFRTENRYDGLSIYDGIGTTTLLSSGLPVGTDPVNAPAGSYYGTNSPGTVYSTAADGSLTFVFKADYLVTYAGWAATVSCVTLPIVTSFTPTTNGCGGTGTAVTIYGSGFTGLPITSVKFNGVTAAYTVISDTQINTTLPAGATSGVITVSNAEATGTSPTAFQVLGAPPVTTGISVCPAATSTTSVGSLTSATNCLGYGNSGFTINGTFTAGDPSAPRPNSTTNSSTCGFTTTPRQYTSVTFQVSVTGSYTFTMPDNTNDTMAYITTGAFSAGSCGGGTFIVGDDDSGPGLQPMMTATLTQGVTYTLFTTTYSVPSSYISFSYTVTTATAGEIMLLTNTVNWYASAVSTTVLGSGASFDPVVLGLVDPTISATTVFYAACASNTSCRTATNFTIKAAPTVTITAGANICPNTVQMLTASGTANTYTWTASPSNTLFSDATGSTLYVAGTNATTVYIKTPSTTTVTVTGTDTTTSCTKTATSVQTVFNKVWNGVGWNGNGLAPVAGEGIIINGSGTFGNLSGCSCTVNSGTVVMSSGSTMTLTGDLNVAGGTLTFNDTASLLQTSTSPTNTNTGVITYKRNTNMRKFDYTYWSSPVDLQILASLSPLTMPDKYFWFNTTTYLWEQVAVPGTTPMDIARGYIIRGPQNFDPVAFTPFVGIFSGKPNSGDYSIPIANGGVNHDLNCIGNPYPSAISANAFILGNTAAFGSPAGTTLYFWTHNSNMVNNQYLPTDYATYNFSGGTGTGTGVAGFNNAAPNGYIAAGQGFMAKGTNLASTTAVFKNSMRVAANNTQFYRTNAPAAVAAIDGLERNRVWLDLQNENGTLYKQILVGYIENATDAYDNGFDGEVIEAGNPVSFYSVTADKKLSIQGKALPFNEADVIPLGYRASTSGSYKITLSDFDGVFDNQRIYLEDKLLQVLHPLNTSPYIFVSESGTFDSRFVLRFTDTLLSVATPQFNANAVVVVKQNADIHVRTSTVKMKTVQLYDVRGRLVAEQQNVDSNSVVFAGLNLANQVLIVNITSEDGVVVSKKIVF